MKVFINITGFLVLFFLTSQANKPVENKINVIHLSERVLIIQFGDVYPDQIVAVRSEKGIIIIDSGISPSLTKIYRQKIFEIFQSDEFIYVINTHDHFDHTNGNQVFNEATIISHEDCPKAMSDFDKNVDDFIGGRKERIKRRQEVSLSLPDFSKLFMRYEDLRIMTESMIEDYESNFKLTIPNLTFKDKLRIDIEHITMYIYFAGKVWHSDNDIIVSIPEEGLVFTGDILNDYPTYSNISSSSDLNRLIQVFDNINEENEIKHIVTIHSGLLTKNDFDKFYYEIKKLNIEMQSKKPAVNVLKDISSAAQIESAFKILNAMKDKYYYSEGDFINYSNELYDEKLFDEAVVILEFAEALFPKSVDIKINVADTYQRIEQYE